MTNPVVNNPAAPPVAPAPTGAGVGAGDTPITPSDKVNPGKHLGQNRTEHPGLHLGLGHTTHPVNPKRGTDTGSAGTGEQPPTATTPEDPTTPVATKSPEAPAAPRFELPQPAQHARVEQPVTQVAPTTVQPTSAMTTTTTTAPTPAVTTTVSVPDQVFDRITGLTSAGNGTHRITMKLQPEALGEVRVVLTVRDGAVHVRLAAGQEARAALLEGSPELKQLLERAGATDAKVVVRELPTSAVAAVQQPNGAAQAQTSAQHGHQNAQGDQPPQAGQSATQTPATDTTSTDYPGLGGGDRSPDRHAGTRADHLATDGDDHSRGHREGGRRDVTPIRSGTRSAAAGLDLTL
ncbi:flagellar hook-length control protein FliK [Nocardioides marmorisolisilvae]|uniref:Flagellar hook-length control protein FliK n=1 Tax=Nocardioides marmorisolisilvae TaxID=1542737 RepID=A0A3N0DX97_9ACTN|nr:flagellar hook-length control protein FliK [Nocardioides marmorisolisilvae]